MLNRFAYSLLLLVVVSSTPSWASTTTFQPLSMEVKPGDQLVVSGFRGSVTIESDDSLKMMSVTLKQVTPKNLPGEYSDSLDEWLFSFQRVQNRIEAKVGSPLSKSLWAKLLANPQYQPEFKMIIKGPSIPVTLSWRQGPIQVKSWNASVKLNTLSSDVRVVGGEGPVSATQQEGVLKIVDRSGAIGVDTYKVVTEFNKIKGPIHVQNFSGKSKIAETDGKIDIYSYSGSFDVADGKGQIQFESDRGKIYVKKYEGDLTSETDIGSVYATLLGQARVKIKSRQGNVSLSLPNSGANVNVGTEKGSLNVPNYLRLTRLPNLQLMTGRLRGKNSGRVYVRTESGGIRIR